MRSRKLRKKIRAGSCTGDARPTSSSGARSGWIIGSSPNVRMKICASRDARISIRNVRRHAKDELEKLAKDGETGEDDVNRAEKELEKVTQRHVGAVDELVKHKESELLEV